MIERYERDGLAGDTVRDADRLFETAVRHPPYDDRAGSSSSGRYYYESR